MMGKKVLAAKSGRAACPNAAAGGGIGAKNAKGAKTKPSGIPWIGDIPERWEVGRLKNYFAKTFSGVWGNESGMNENTIVCYRIADFDFSKGILSDGRLTKRSYHHSELAGRIVLKGDLLLEKSGGGDLNPVGRAVIVQYDIRATCSNFIQDLRCDAKHSEFYVEYVLRALYFKGVNGLYYNQTIGIQNLQVGKFLSVVVPMPPLPVQRAIVAYLDEKCGAIDAAVAEAKKGIEEYKAWKKSLIFEAVNGDWEKRRLRFLADITTGNKDTQDAEPDGAYPFYVRSPIVERSTDYTFEGPGIMMAGDGAGAGRVFHYAVGKYAVHQRVYRIYNFRGIEGRFLLYALGAIFPLEMDKGSAQSTVPSVRLPMLKDLLIPLPPLAEQLAIVDHLDEKCAAIDKMVAEKNALIADLEAYKKSLIYETVTGKREVASNSMVK